MNYQNVYSRLVDRAKTRQLIGYKEKHHIVPKCLGGSNKSANLVELTVREHYICHLLLVKIHPDNPKLWYALDAMITFNQQTRYTPSSRIIEEIKIKTVLAKQNTCWVHKDNKSSKICLDVLSSYLEEGWKKGRAVSFNKGKIAVVHQNKTTYIHKKDLNQYLEKGYTRGNTLKGRESKKASAKQKGRVCINDGKKTKRVLKEELEHYLGKGWKKGYHYLIDYSTRDYTKNKGRVCVYREGIEKRIKKIELNQYLENGWKRGHCLENKKK